MAWALVVALAVVGVWWWRTRAQGPRIVAPAEPSAGHHELAQGGARPMSLSGTERGVDTRTLLEAFRSDEYQIPEDAERQDRELLVRLLQLLQDVAAAHEVVLWQPVEGTGGHLIAAAWSRGSEPPALTEGDRLLLELAAAEGRCVFNPGGDGLRLVACGVPVNDGAGALSVHYRSTPAMPRDALLPLVARFGEEIASRHEVLRTRANLARRSKRLRSMIRTAITLQGSKDPIALEEVLVTDAGLVAGAAWAVLVRGTGERGEATIARRTEGAPAVFKAGVKARGGTLVGGVFATGKARVHPDTRPLQAVGEPIFDDVTLPNDVRSLIAIPIRRSERATVIGVLLLGHPERNRFSQADSHSAADLGTIAAGALDTAWAWQDANTSAKTDQLTGLPNRRAFEEEFARMIAETDRFGNTSALVIVDVDFFKKVNDTYGHDAGDQVLKAVGATLSREARGTDKVARLGGEELAMLLPQTDEQGALGAAERCRRAIEALEVRTAVGPVKVTASFGVAMYAQRSGGAGTLFDRADQALYAAKRDGRNRVVLAGN